MTETKSTTAGRVTADPDRNLALELVRATEAAAINCSRCSASVTRTPSTPPRSTRCARCSARCG